MSKNKKNRKYGTFIDGIAASQHLDSSGERISVRGIDISSLTKDGTITYEHKNDQSSQVVGKIIEAKKIYKKSDCDNDRHQYYWDKCKLPFLYVSAELFDAFEHTGAKDLVAHLKYDAQGHINKEARNVVNFSIEGSRLEERGSDVKKCIARKVTATVTPCNKIAGAEIQEEKAEDVGLDKTSEGMSLISEIMAKSEITKVHLMKADSFVPKRTFSPSEAPETPKVGDRIDHSKPNTKPKPDQYGKVILKSKNKMKKATGLPGEFSPQYAKESSPKETAATRAKVDVSVKSRQYKDRDKQDKARAKASGSADATTAVIKKLGVYDSNMRKAIAAGSGLGAPSTKTQGGALQKENIEKEMVNVSKGAIDKSKVRKMMKSLADQAFACFDKKEELISFLKSELPTISEQEIVALAKTVAFMREKRQEIKIKSLMDKKDV